MTQQMEQLGAALKAGREALGIQQKDLAVRLGVERNTLRLIEGGSGSRITNTIRAYAREIGWTDGSIEQVQAGGEPTRRDDVLAATSAIGVGIDAEQLGLMPRIYLDLKNGRILDQALIDLTPTGSLAVAMILVERPDEGASPEQIATDLRAWSRVQRQLLKLMAQSQESNDAGT